MVEYIAKDGERLDQLCYRFYKSLEELPRFLTDNAPLCEEAQLKAGDKVKIPEYPPKPVEKAKALW
ncbi:MAG: tail protein X [Helicobacteraceae bacterium]|jgi:phage tail protein X|nr:tail protein X [Helicobacteraceae bacterium]